MVRCIQPPLDPPGKEQQSNAGETAEKMGDLQNGERQDVPHPRET